MMIQIRRVQDLPPTQAIPPDRDPGVWIAVKWPDEAFTMATFEEEVEALRYALGRGMRVGYLPFGQQVEWVK